MIKFEKLRWKNILSTGNTFTEIDLLRSTNTLIIGHNGAGKSTILDALCFALFGKPFRKINKPSLLNSINQAEGVVEVEFSIGRKQYKVVRGIKPNIFEIYCNGAMVNQDAKVKDYQEQLEKFILKLNFKSFTQVVILGSASFVPFMQLSPGDRRTIIEDLLDINIFSSMNAIVKDKMSVIKDESTKNKYAMELISEKIKLQKQNIEEHKKHSSDEIEKKRGEVTTSEQQIEQLNIDIELIQKHIQSLLKRIADEKSVNDKSSKLIQLESKMESKLKKINKDIFFYNDHDECPTCRQNINQDFKNEELNNLNKSSDEITKALADIDKQIQSANDRINEISKINQHISEHNNEIVKHNSTISAVNKYISKLNKEITELESLHINLDSDNSVLKELKTNLQEAITKQEELSNNKQYLEYASTLLKDTGIKTKIIKQYLPIMNKLINKYLTAMDFFVNFNINENFEETIKSRHRDEFSYANFSEGEKMRIDLALLFTWRQIAKMKNSTNTNLLILDEVFDSSLDGVGTEEFLKLIHDMGTDTNVFVISHKGDQLFDKFRSIIKFEKKNNFSQMVR
jgi:DNA repair exonuclease SbcCD ATPase subunit